MKLELTNENYCATIVKVKNIQDIIEEKDWVSITLNMKKIVIGSYSILSTSLKEDDLMILFTAETELAKEYLSVNSLYSDSNLNKDISKKWYIDKKWRIRAIRLRWYSSNALLMPLSSLAHFLNTKDFKEWDMFNSINWFELCKKYEVPVKNSLNWSKTLKWIHKKYQRIDGKFFPEHIDTSQYWRNENQYDLEEPIVVTQKLHWTSWRFWNLKCKIKPGFWDKILKRQRTEYDYLAWSRKVIKDLKSDDKFNHFYKVEWLDIYNRALEKIKHTIPKDTILFWEIIGYVWDNSEIQKWYSYNCKNWEFEVYIYRIASINTDWYLVDYSWSAVKEFCKNQGLKYVPELWVWLKKFFKPELFLDVNYSQTWYYYKEEPIALHKDRVDEGICIRKEWILPLITKHKSAKFLEYETKLLDEEVEILS